MKVQNKISDIVGHKGYLIVIVPCKYPRPKNIQYIARFNRLCDLVTIVEMHLLLL